MNSSAVRAGIIGAAVLTAFYALVVGGFGTQNGLFTELCRRKRLHADVRAATGGGAGASAVGMVACCAHHIADRLFRRSPV